MISNFYHVIKNDIFTYIIIILDMKCPKCPYIRHQIRENIMKTHYLRLYPNKPMSTRKWKNDSAIFLFFFAKAKITCVINSTKPCISRLTCAFFVTQQQ